MYFVKFIIKMTSQPNPQIENPIKFDTNILMGTVISTIFGVSTTDSLSNIHIIFNKVGGENFHRFVCQFPFGSWIIKILNENDVSSYSICDKWNNYSLASNHDWAISIASCILAFFFFANTVRMLHGLMASLADPYNTCTTEIYPKNGWSMIYLGIILIAPSLSLFLMERIDDPYFFLAVYLIPSWIYVIWNLLILFDPKYYTLRKHVIIWLIFDVLGISITIAAIVGHHYWTIYPEAKYWITYVVAFYQTLAVVFDYCKNGSFYFKQSSSNIPREAKP
jgi:hypothetical protein